MAGNFGIGLGSFMSGLAGGAGFAMNFKNNMAREERAAKDQAFQDTQRERLLAEQGRTDANAAGLRETTAGVLRAADGARAQDLLNGQDAAPLADYFYQKAGSITDKLLQSGEVEQAQKFQNFLQDENSKRGTLAWGKAAQSLMAGDLDNGFQQVNSALANPGYGNGVTQVKQWKQLPGKDGKPGNLQLTFLDKGSDKERVEEMDLPELQHFIITQASPVAAFTQLQKSVEQGQKLQVDVAKQVAKSRIDQGAALAKEGRANQEHDRRFGLREESDLARDQQRDAAATERVVTQSQLRSAEKTAAANAKPPVDKSQSQVAGAYRDLLANDPKFGDMSESEKERRVAQYLESQDRVVSQRRGGAASAPALGVRPRTAFGQ